MALKNYIKNRKNLERTDNFITIIQILLCSDVTERNTRNDRSSCKTNIYLEKQGLAFNLSFIRCRMLPRHSFPVQLFVLD